MRWYYVVNGEVVGPVRTHYLSRILKQGLIHNKTYVYNKEVLKDWTRIKNVSDLIKNLTKQKTKESDRSSNYPTHNSNILRYNRRRNKSKGKNKGDQEGKRHRKRTRKYYREKAKRKVAQPEEVEEDIEVEEVVDDQSESSSSEEDKTQDSTIDLDSGLPVVDPMPLKNGDWIETINNQIGRVLYIGPVKGIPGEAVGIELSNPEGDCDGVFDGHRYFQCKKSHGQFLNKRLIKKNCDGPLIHPRITIPSCHR